MGVFMLQVLRHGNSCLAAIGITAHFSRLLGSEDFKGFLRPARGFGYRLFAYVGERRHNKHRASGRSHRAFSDTANQRTAKSGPTMRRDDDQIGPLLATASWIAVGQYPATADVRTGTPSKWTGQESSHLFTASPARCFGVSGRIVFPPAVVIITGPRSVT